MNERRSSLNCEKTLTVQCCARVPHQLTLPLYDLGPWIPFIKPLNLFADGPGHYAGHNEAEDHADVFQYVAFQGTFLFGFLCIMTRCKQRRCFSSISIKAHRWACQCARIYPAVIIDLDEKDAIAKGILPDKTLRLPMSQRETRGDARIQPE
jgi:hypothetical protein